MGPDFSFFALLLLLAQSLAPQASQELTWVNGDHPDQTITFRRDGDAWDLTVNGHAMGRLQREVGAIVLQQEGGEPTRFETSQLADPVRPDARTARLRGSFAGTTLRIERGSGIRLVDPQRAVLGTSLRLRAQ